MTVNADAVHRLVVDDFVPDIFKKVVEFMFIGGMTADIIIGVGEFAVEKLLFKTPEDASVEEIMVKAHEITLDVEFDGEGLASVVFGDLADVMGEALLAVECAFADATRIRIGAKAAVPPAGANIEEEMMNHAVAEGRSDNFTDDGVMDDKGDATAGFIVMTNEAVAEINDIFHGIELELVFVDG